MNDADNRKITVSFSRQNTSIKEYLVKQIFQDWLGVEATAVFSSDIQDEAVISIYGREVVRFPDLLIEHLKEHDGKITYPTPNVYPLSLHISQRLIRFAVPYGVPAAHTGVPDLRLTLGSIDFFGSIFFLLAGLDELSDSSEDFDRHGRIIDERKWLVRAGQELTPVVDCLVHGLAELLRGSSVDVPQSGPSYFMTCDVDYPIWGARKSFSELVKAVLADCFVRHEPLLCFRRIVSWLSPRNMGRLDPFATLPFMVDESRRQGWIFEAYLLEGRFDSKYAGNVLFREPVYLRTIETLIRRGAKIGIHVSYEGSMNAALCEHELYELNSAIERVRVERTLGGGSEELISRSHYLRWMNGVTEKLYDAAGVSKDSTLAFARRPGYRRGTSREFLVFDLAAMRALTMHEQPLLLMDVHVVSSSGRMNVQTSRMMARYVDRFKWFSDNLGTPLTVLVHNSTLQTKAARRLFLQLVRTSGADVI